jgi:hypothetical protein
MLIVSVQEIINAGVSAASQQEKLDFPFFCCRKEITPSRTKQPVSRPATSLC